MTGMSGPASPESSYVTWARWDAEHRALREREDTLRAALEDRLTARIKDTEERCTVLEQARAGTRARNWLIAMAFLSGLVLPLTVAAVTAWVQSHG